MSYDNADASLYAYLYLYHLPYHACVRIPAPVPLYQQTHTAVPMWPVWHVWPFGGLCDPCVTLVCVARTHAPAPVWRPHATLCVGAVDVLFDAHTCVLMRP